MTLFVIELTVDSLYVFACKVCSYGYTCWSFLVPFPTLFNLFCDSTFLVYANIVLLPILPLFKLVLMI